ncbi:F-box domain-containing protein [Heracleum sosnowskyi]|uniref:F-box domain-containing protein n=1 Tax=Heracleum sosnowskyi TaxID=360622 RepID=A0AAD8JBD1_9APIA|nr:F-box domain-containing protein [Heracleum sosnowskyi]
MGNIKSSLTSGSPKDLALKLIKGKKTDNVVDDSLFPPEIIIEILSWLPIEFSGRVMLVCKQWYALIQDRHFMEKQMSRADKEFRKYVLCYENDVSADSDNENESFMHYYSTVYACDGLHLEKDRFKNKYRICNPTTKRVLELPDPHEGSHGIVFSYVPSTSNYKFVSIYDDESSTECCEVFSVENDESSWRLLGMPTRDYPNRNRKKCSVVSTGDAVHCVRVIAIGAVMVEEVVSLDLGTEQFTVTNFPRGQYQSWEKVWPLNFMGKLALVDRMEADLCVFVLEDYKKQKWSKRRPLIPSASLKILEDMHGTISPYCFDQSEMLWFWVKDRSMFLSYNVRAGKERGGYLYKKGYKLMEVMRPLQQSLVHLKGMQPEDKKSTQPPPLKDMQPEDN